MTVSAYVIVSIVSMAMTCESNSPSRGLLVSRPLLYGPPSGPFPATRRDVTPKFAVTVLRHCKSESYTKMTATRKQKTATQEQEARTRWH